MSGLMFMKEGIVAGGKPSGIRGESAMTRLLCMRLGTGQPGATLVTCIL